MMITLTEAARKYEVSELALRKRAASGEIRSSWQRQRIYVNEDDVRAYKARAREWNPVRVLPHIEPVHGYRLHRVEYEDAIGRPKRIGVYAPDAAKAIQLFTAKKPAARITRVKPVEDGESTAGMRRI